MKKLICIAMCILLCACSANEASTSSLETSVSNSELESSSIAEKEVELLLDTTIVIDENNYIEYKISKGLFSTAVCNFDGTNLEKEYATVGIIFIINKELGIDNFIVAIKSADDSAHFAFANGNLLKVSEENKYSEIELDKAVEKYSDELFQIIIDGIKKEK